MDADTPRHEDDMSDLASRLGSWRPTADGLDADAMLFAAGLAAGRRGRGVVVVSVLCGFLAILAVGFGVWGLNERAERQSLASRLRDRIPDSSAYPVSNADLASQQPYRPAQDDYLHLYRQLEEDANGSLASRQPAGPRSLGPPPQPAILTPRQRDRLLD
jgi:hypothetical protein